MTNTKINIRGTLRKMEPGTQMVFTPEITSLRYLRNVTCDMKNSGYIFAVNKEGGIYKVTRKL